MSKKEIAVVVVLGALILFYFPILRMLGFIDEQPVQVADQTTQQENQTQQEATNIIQSEKPLAYTETQEIQAESVAIDSLTQKAPVRIDSIYVNTEKYKITLSSLGGGPVSILLNEYSYRDGNPIEMLLETNEATPTFRFSNGNFDTKNVNFISSVATGIYDVENEPLELSYSYTNAQGGVLTKKFIFYPDRYDFDLVLDINDPAKFKFDRKYQVIWNTPMPVTEPQPETDYEAMQAVAMQSEQRLTLDDFDNNKLNEIVDGDTDWAGVRNKFFCSVIIPRGDNIGISAVASGTIFEITTNDGTIEKKSLICGMEIEFSELYPVHDSFTVFVGAMDYNQLSEYDIGLEDLLDIGTTPFIGWIIKPFAMAIMWLLPLMYGFIPNYGIVIILFALLVKIVTLPLSMKSFKSMQAMKVVQPKMEELKKKHKNNPQALNKDMMKLYKDHGVNPLSGCLPMIPQMPLFFAMFSVFRSTILLRDAPFFWFIDDLSRGASGLTDPYIFLVLIMVGAQFISSKMTMATTPQNKAIIYIMPIFMGWIFHTFAAGLVLYWTCFSLFSLIDYFLFKRNNGNASTNGMEVISK